MTTARTVSKNMSYLLAGYGISQVLRVAYVAVLARYIGAGGLGQLTAATALVSLLAVIVSFGLNPLLVREVAAGRPAAPSYVANAAFLRLALALVFSLFLAGVVSQSPYSPETRAIIAIYAVSYVLDSLSDVARAVFNGYQRMEYRTAVDLFRDVANVGFSLLGIHLGWSLIAIVAVSAGASLLRLVISVVLMWRRFLSPVMRVDLSVCRHIVASGLPFFLLSCVSVASDRLGTVVLSWMSTADAVGMYAAASFLISVLLVVPEMFMESIYPVFSSHFRTSAASLSLAYRAAYKSMLVLGFPMGVGMMVVSRPAITLAYGAGFAGAAPVANLLAIQLMTMVGFVNGAYLNATNRQSFFSVLRLGSIALLLVACVGLIPLYGYVGAAWAAAITAVADFGLYSVLCHRYAGLPLPWATIAKAAVGSALMGSASYFLLRLGANVLVVALLAPVIYGAMLVALKVLDPEESAFISGVLPVGRVRRLVAGLAGRQP